MRFFLAIPMDRKFSIPILNPFRIAKQPLGPFKVIRILIYTKASNKWVKRKKRRYRIVCSIEIKNKTIKIIILHIVRKNLERIN